MKLARVRTAIPKVWRVSRKTVFWAFGLVVALIAIVVAINALDENLSPATERLLKAPPNPWTPEQNLYLALMGFDAPVGESTIEVGIARVAAHDKEADELGKNPQAVPASAKHNGSDRLQFVGKMDFCSPVAGSCWIGVEQHRQEIEGLLQANQILYERYLDLRRRSGFYETAKPSIDMSVAYITGEVRKLFLANVALRIKAADSVQQRTAALADLYSDIETWRRMLVGEGSLISKMIVIVNLHGDFALLSDLIADSTVDTEQLDHGISAILGLLDENDWKLRGLFAHEFRVSQALLNQFWHDTSRPWVTSAALNGEEAKWWEPYAGRIEAHFLQINATENLSARSMIELQRVADSGATGFLTARDAYDRWVEDNLELNLRYAYNPMGRVLVAVGAQSYTVYLLRTYDVEAFVRLVRLGYEVRRLKLRPEDIAPFMEAHRHLATHPVDGRLFTWDASKREMAIQPLAPPRYERRFSVPIWTAVAH